MHRCDGDDHARTMELTKRNCSFVCTTSSEVVLSHIKEVEKNPICSCKIWSCCNIMSTTAIITCSVLVGIIRVPQASRLALTSSLSRIVYLALAAFVLPIIPCAVSVVLAARGLTAYSLQVHVFTFSSLAWLDWVNKANLSLQCI
jgi:hypothetical protein